MFTIYGNHMTGIILAMGKSLVFTMREPAPGAIHTRNVIVLAAGAGQLSFSNRIVIRIPSAPHTASGKMAAALGRYACGSSIIWE